MNAYRFATAQNTVKTAGSVARQYVAATTPSRPPHRTRDFGVGYGTSSGYASARSYAPTNVVPLFRCV